jgi:hypothetical protein
MGGGPFLEDVLSFGAVGVDIVTVRNLMEATSEGPALDSIHRINSLSSKKPLLSQWFLLAKKRANGA